MASTDPVWYVTAIPSETKDAQRVDVSLRILSLTYEDEEAKQDKLKLTVDNFDLSNFDSPIFKTGNKLEVSWGYPGKMSPTRTVTISKVTGSVQLTVEALDDASNMNKVQKVRQFEKMSRTDVAKQIAQEHGYSLDKIIVDDTEEVMEQVTQARMTDAQLLSDMARREGFEFYVDFDGFHWHARKLSQPPTRTFHYYGDPERGDIISWNVDNDIYSAGKTGAVSVQARDPKTKEPIAKPGDNTAKRTALAPIVGLVPGSDSGAHTRKVIINKGRSTIVDLPPVPTATARQAASGTAVIPSTETTPASVKRQAEGMYKKAQMNAINLTLECYGDPEQLAKCVVRVIGIGSTLSGNYWVTAVHHKLGSGYVMTVKLKRDGKTDGLAAQALGTGHAAVVKPKAPVNDAKPAEPVAQDAPPAPLESRVSFSGGRSKIVYNSRHGGKGN